MFPFTLTVTEVYISLQCTFIIPRLLYISNYTQSIQIDFLIMSGQSAMIREKDILVEDFHDVVQVFTYLKMHSDPGPEKQIQANTWLEANNILRK